MKKNFLINYSFILILLLCGSFGYAQSVTGKVTDANGTPLPGASVIVKGTSNGTQTDFDGNYSINAGGNSTLVFSYVGFSSKEENVGGRSIVNITLQESASALDEVVVIGYGSQKKEAVTGAVSTISSEEITTIPAPSFTEAMQGRMPGVQVTNNGAPGTSPIVRIRGIGSISFASSPLYVVDGYPVGGLRDFDNNDIASISVLKDASAAAIYGSRAANGVVLITTKKGRNSEKLDVELSSYTGFGQASNKLDLLNREQYLEYGRELLGNAGDPFPSRWSNLNEPIYPGANQTYAQTDVDYQDAVFQSGFTTNHYLSLTGGSEMSKFFTSFGYFKQEGIMVGTGYERYNVRINSDHDIHKKVHIGQTLTIATGETENEANSGGRTQIQHIIRSIPYIPIYDPTLPGGYRAPDAADGSDPENPVRTALLDRSFNNNVRILGTGYVGVDLFEGLSYKFIAGVDWSYNRAQTILPIYFDGFKGRERKEIRDNRSTFFGTYFSNQLTYARSFGDHNIDFIGIAERQDGTGNNLNAYAQRDSNDLDVLGGADPDSFDIQGGYGETTIYSYAGRLNYDFAGKYLISASLRRDGNSKFADGKKWQTFPGVSAGWNIAKENWFKDSSLSELKVRGSWGQVGFEGIGTYESQAGINQSVTGIFNNQQFQGAYFDKLPNENLEWEVTTMVNVGLDVGLYNNRLQFSGEWYQRETDNLILNIPLANSLGYSGSTLGNIGGMENWGLEFQGSYFSNPNNDFKWDVSLNMSLYRNEVLSLANDTGAIFAGANGDTGGEDITRTAVGDPIQQFYGWKVEGIFQSQAEIDDYNSRNPNGNYQDNAAPGDLIFEDLNGDGTITADDRTIIGNFIPDFTYGFNFSAEYKNFYMSMFWNGVQGNDVYNAARVYMEGGLRLFNAGTQVLDAWTPQNTNTDIPRMVNGDPNANTRTSDRFIEDGSYLRLRNLRFGYRIPSDWLNSSGDGFIEAIDLYVSGTNLLTFTDYEGYDPEIGSRNNNTLTQGIDYGQYPQPRTILFGFKAKF
ncbi:SusC/RagA family TonB-linked outer membrane protein [Galbibacter mesophilus]|uniref:SusC/RagA family TonB-linked outer membrane protein n=1 Tax=Galbibacter mesophilus TaxID=379069 RepID=UPI00191FC255|nr:TonB-dependent receptor [Galbibacter mesophilus]MCM5663696.1 TonB-dependent receptor [Galbibacter mesophilus]